MTQHPYKDPADTPEVRELFEVITSCYPSATGFSGVVVRSVSTKYATQSNFFSGVGASKSGGRWNRKGIEATYASLDVETAIKEAYQNLLHYGFPISNIRPRTTAGARVKLKKVLDITVPATLQKIGFKAKDLVIEDWRAIQLGGEESWTQSIGRGCFLAGFEGLIVPSARNPKGKNLVMFLSNFMKSSVLEILGKEDLK
jgi:RES domain-containing protein